MNDWTDTGPPCLDPDNSDPMHQGHESIPPFQTHSRFFYAPLGESCCGRRFVHVFFLQMHPFPHCKDCALDILNDISYLCWQCRTYFRRYGTAQIQQLVGITYQRHDPQSIHQQDQDNFQPRLPDKQAVQDQRTHSIFGFQPPILQILLPRLVYQRCEWWGGITDELNQ